MNNPINLNKVKLDNAYSQLDSKLIELHDSTIKTLTLMNKVVRLKTQTGSTEEQNKLRSEYQELLNRISTQVVEFVDKH